MKRTPVIIDTDPGIDDFFAIMMANSSDKLDIKAITTVAGNQRPETVTKNASDIASYFNINTEVAKGAEKPMNIELYTAGNIHGENGLGNVKLNVKGRPLSKDYAWDVIYKNAVSEKGRLEIIAIGPLTNVATALLKYPDLKDLISRIVIMGGSAGIGNVTPYGEFNAVVDPLAAKIVFRSGIKLAMVGWDAATTSELSQDEVKLITDVKNQYSRDCTEILNFLQETYKNLGKEKIILSDALAVAYAINPDVLKCKDCFVAVETFSTLNTGRTVVDLDHAYKDKPLNCTVGIKADKELYLSMFVSMMKHYCKN